MEISDELMEVFREVLERIRAILSEAVATSESTGWQCFNQQEKRRTQTSARNLRKPTCGNSSLAVKGLQKAFHISNEK
ncbi:hypothetical protein HNY73_005393 [Argiope bruennichi]|uniref:Uncharacterized protein n=1 Tax=Argiope bruennichi TaxID=94029 RepID=A0A8T0FJ00_ARGBR|nr:hypothetical protein HNY73_005393 [Argiope bruennichi]